MIWDLWTLGIIFIALIFIFFLYVYFKPSNKTIEGFDLASVAFCSRNENMNQPPCSTPDVPLIGPETSTEAFIYDTYEKNNFYNIPTFTQTTQAPYDTSKQLTPTDYSQGIPWDIDNAQADTNVVLWGFVNPTCSKDLFTMNYDRITYGSINNFQYDESSKVFAYKIPLFNNLQVSDPAKVAQFKYAEFITNFAMGTAIEMAWEEGVKTPLWNLLERKFPFLAAEGALNNFQISQYKNYRAGGMGVIDARINAKADGKLFTAIQNYNPAAATPDKSVQQLEQAYKSSLSTEGSKAYDALSQAEKSKALTGHVQSITRTPEMAAKLAKNAKAEARVLQIATKYGPAGKVYNLFERGARYLWSFADPIKSVYKGVKGFLPIASEASKKRALIEDSANNAWKASRKAGDTAVLSNTKAAQAAREAQTAYKGGKRASVKITGQLAKPVTTQVLDRVGSKAVSALVKRMAEKIGVRLMRAITISFALMGILSLTGPVGWALDAFLLVWTLAMVIIVPIIMDHYVPADGVCPVGYPFNLKDAVVNSSGAGAVGWEILTNIPEFGDGMAAFGPYLCTKEDGSDTKVKINYQSPIYYFDPTLSIFANDMKPMMPESDPGYGDKRQYYEVVGYDYDLIQSQVSINDYMMALNKTADLTKSTKNNPPVWVDFSDPVMLNKMAEYYYKKSKRLPYTNFDGTLSFEYITKIYGVVASSKYSCDIQCEITIDTIYPFTGVLKSSVISPPDPLGNTYHDRRFYFLVDDTDLFHNKMVNGRKIQYIFRAPNQYTTGPGSDYPPPLDASADPRPVRNNTLYANSGATNWDSLMSDNMMRYIITGCTCVDGTAPGATDSPSAGYAPDNIISVGNPGADYFPPTLTIGLNNQPMQFPVDETCNFARARNINSKTGSIPTRATNQTPNAYTGTTNLIYEGSLLATMPTLSLTLALSGTALSFTQVDATGNLNLNIQRQISPLLTASGLQADTTNSAPIIGNAVRIKAISGSSTFSFDANIAAYSQVGTATPATQSYVNATLSIRNIRKITGPFSTDGSTALTNIVILYAKPGGWPAPSNGTKIWQQGLPKPTSNYQQNLSIFQGVVTATIAQAPGLTPQWQFYGGLITSTLDATGISNQIACSYADMNSQSGTYIINGFVMQNQNDNSVQTNQIVTSMGPTIDYSPGYTPVFDKRAGMQMTHRDCINRYNVRVAVKKYTDLLNNTRIIKSINNITLDVTNNICLYDVTQVGFDPTLVAETSAISNPSVTFGLIYSNNNATNTFVPTNITLTPPVSKDKVDPVAENNNYLKANYAVSDILQQNGPVVYNAINNINRVTTCKEYPAMIYSCASYKMQNRLFDDFNYSKGSNPAISTDNVNSTAVGTCVLTANPVNGSAAATASTTTITYTRTGTAPIVNSLVVFQQDPPSVGGFRYSFEGVVNAVVSGTQLSLTSISIIWPFIESISNGVVDTSQMLMKFTIYNSEWIIPGISIHITASTTRFIAYVNEYTNNILTCTPLTDITQLASQPAGLVTFRLNERCIFNFVDPTSSSSIVLPFTNPRWIQAGISGLSVTCITGYNVYTFTASVGTPDATNNYSLSVTSPLYTTSWLVATANVLIYNGATQIYSGAISAITTSSITLTGSIAAYSIPTAFSIRLSSDQTKRVLFTGTIKGLVMTPVNLATTYHLSWTTENFVGPTFNMKMPNAYSVIDPVYGPTCTYDANPQVSTYNTATDAISVTAPQMYLTMTLRETSPGTNEDTSNCLYSLAYDNYPTAFQYPPIPQVGNVLQLPAPIPPTNTAFNRPGCNTDCSGIDIMSALVDQYNTTNADAKILKVIRSYTPIIPGGQAACEYQVEMSRRIPGTSRDHLTKRETIRFMLTPDPNSSCLYKYIGYPLENSGFIFNANTYDPTTGYPDSFAVNPPYVWSQSLISRYRTFINNAISGYQSMTPSWQSILKRVSATSESKMQKLYNDVAANKTLGGCNNMNCRDSASLLSICAQYNYDNYPPYFGTNNQYGYIQKSIIEVRRGGVGGTSSQCQIELIERQDFYEDYTLPPVNTDDPSQAQYNTKFFLRQYQFNVNIANCVVVPIALTPAQLSQNIMDISSTPFGIESDTSIISPKYSVPSIETQFNINEFYSVGFLQKIKTQYNSKLINTAPPLYNTLTNFVNAFVVSPTICEYQIKITRQMYSKDYGIWYDTDNIDSYIIVQTDKYTTGRNISGTFIEYINMDITFSLQNNAYVPLIAGAVVSLPYMFYADLTNPVSRVKGFSSTPGTMGLPNTATTALGLNATTL